MAYKKGVSLQLIEQLENTLPWLQKHKFQTRWLKFVDDNTSLKVSAIRKLHLSAVQKKVCGEEIKLNESSEQLEQSFREKTTKKCSYVFSTTIAKRVVNSIMSSRANPTAPLLEISPGVGLIAKEFINQGVGPVIGLETEEVFDPFLQRIQDQYGMDKFEFRSWSILNIFEKFNPSPASKDHKHSYSRNELAVITKLSKSPFVEKDAPYGILRLGGSQENHDFLFYILRNLPSEDPILSKNRVEFFFLVHPKFKGSVEQILPIDKPSGYTRCFSYFHTFICLLYDISFIEEFQISDFVPSFSKTGVNRKIDPSKRYLTKMQLKENISEILPFDHHFAFSIFLRHIFRKRKVRIVPVMETLVTGCGIHMLATGFTMMETVADVSPLRLLQLYKRMLHWPEYSVSHLKNHILMKTQGGPMEDDV